MGPAEEHGLRVWQPHLSGVHHVSQLYYGLAAWPASHWETWLRARQAYTHTSGADASTQTCQKEEERAYG